MINVSAYYKQDMEYLIDKQYDIVVNSVGHYRLITKDKFATIRLEGRSDYQILYMARGRGRFLLDGVYHMAEEGSFVLYGPEMPQEYEYIKEDTPDVYWVHFTGREPELLLEEEGLSKPGIYHVGVHSSYLACFQNILKELQTKRPGYVGLASVYLREMILLMGRDLRERDNPEIMKNPEVLKAIRFFHESYQSDISIEDYSRTFNMSVCWFIRCFKKYTGMTPQKYITDIRITKAKELLNDQFYSVAEVAGIVGYQNPLYFSRMFKQYTGCAPSAYGKKG